MDRFSNYTISQGKKGISLTIDRHEKWLSDHEQRIRSVEVNQAVLTDHVRTIRKWAGWAVGILGATLLVQLINMILGRG